MILGLAACGGASAWHKPGTEPEALKRDLVDCQALAYDKVSRTAPPGPPVALDRRFGNLEAPDRTTESLLREQQLVDSCMRAQGYSFEPAAR